MPITIVYPLGIPRQKGQEKATYIVRNASSKSKKTQREVKKRYRDLINSVRWIHGIGSQVLLKLGKDDFGAAALLHYLPLIERIINQAHQRVIEGKTLPPDEKLYSLFEEHTELIVRGKAGKPSKNINGKPAMNSLKANVSVSAPKEASLS